MMADSFRSINQNMEIMNENLKQVTEWPVENEGEIDLQDEREQVSKTPTENVAGEPAKKKSKESKQELLRPMSRLGVSNITITKRHNRFFKAYRIRLQIRKRQALK